MQIRLALSHTLTTCRETGSHPVRLVQAMSGEYHPIPAGLRKRSGTRGETPPLEEILHRPTQRKHRNSVH